MQNPEFENWEGEIGKKVVCPVCGKHGVVGIDKFKAKGKTYTYLVVRHYEGDKTRRCVVKRILEPAKPRQEPAKQQAPIEAYVELEALRQENERLKQENERLRQENEQLRMAIQNVYNARIIQAKEKEREALRLKFVAKKGGLSPEISQLANTIMHSLVSEDWVAVRLNEFESLVKGVGLWQ